MAGYSIMIDDYLVMRPERCPQAEKFIKKGRLIIGHHYTLPEEFTISHEGLIRNLIFGRETVENTAEKCRLWAIRSQAGDKLDSIRRYSPTSA